ncbi:MAG TPA: hypothetical protein VM529_21925 [Gemmata sp.]|nr:hypothetical protein [Gemmata sp.]
MQPLTILYVLTTSGRGRFATMTYLSVQALRRFNPNVRPVLLCDQASRCVLSAQFPALLASFDRVVADPVDISDLRIRSRYLKTIIREAVDGDFVYLDIDTLPVRRFDDIAGEWDVAAVQDRTHYCPVTPCFPYWRALDYEKLGWDHPLPRFYNSGVVFMRDNTATRALSNEWQKRWRELFTIGREDDDQFALTSALYAVDNLRVKELDTRYNAMVRVHPIHSRGAKIYHFFAGNTADMGDSLLEHLIRHFDASGEVDWEAIDRCVALDHPWMPPYWPRRLWQTGNRVRAVVTAARQRLGLEPRVTPASPH